MIISLSFLLCALFTIYYYQTVSQKQIIHDDETKLSQTSRQLQYISDDIATFTASLLISEPVQSFLKTYNNLDTYDKISLSNFTFNYLSNFMGLHQEITSFAFVLPDGHAVWGPDQNDNYFTERMKEPWYQNYVKSKQTFSFTQIHSLDNARGGNTESNTISYIAQVRDLQNGGSYIGEFIVNMDYSMFESLLKFGSKEFDGYIWLNDANNILFEKNGSLSNGIGLNSLLASSSHEEVFQKAASNGYWLVDRFAGHNWKLVSFTSNQTIFNRSRGILYLLIFFTLTTTVLILSLMMPAIFNITKPILKLYQAMKTVSNGNLQASLAIRTGDELEILGDSFNRMTLQLQLHLEESIRYEQDKQKMELELLLSQINPHFIYNTLNTIIYMAEKQNNSDIVRITSSFITLLQDSVKIGDMHAMIPLGEEMCLIRDYAVIQAYRYPGIFEIEHMLEDAALHCLIPRNLLQPLIENAIFHGICPKEEKGTIWIRASIHEGQLILLVEDNGIGIKPEKLRTILEQNGGPHIGQGFRHIGLINTAKRLDTLFRGKAALHIQSIPGQGTKVTIILPEMVEAPQVLNIKKQDVGTPVD